METAAELERAERTVKVRPASSFQHKGGFLRFVELFGFFENFVSDDFEFQSLIFGRHTDDFATVTGFPELLSIEGGRAIRAKLSRRF